MARGKYAAKAERRREFTELEDRAVAAERERDQLATELAEVREASEARISRLRAEVRAIREQRDQGAAPRITQLEAVNNRLRAQRDAVAYSSKGLWRAVQDMRSRLTDFLAERLGITHTEAWELVHALGEVPDSGRLLLARGVASRDAKIVEAVQRARGIRGKDKDSPAAQVQPGSPLVPPKRQLRHLARREVEECLAHSFAYDGEGGSVSIGLVDDGLWIGVESTEIDIVDDAFLLTVIIPAAEALRLAEALDADGAAEAS